MVWVLANFLKWLCDGKQVVPEGLQMRARSGVTVQHTEEGGVGYQGEMQFKLFSFRVGLYN